jgi:hypothetical protein
MAVASTPLPAALARADKKPGGYVVRVPPSRGGLYGKENRSNRCQFRSSVRSLQ